MQDSFFVRQRLAAWIEVTGEDAPAFLQGQFSADLSRGVGQATYGLWLDHRGRIQGDSIVLQIGPEAFILASYATPGEVLVSLLESKIVADEVELELNSDMPSAITLVGGSDPSVHAGWAELAALSEPGRFAEQNPLWAWRGYWGNRREALDVVGPASGTAPFAATLEAKGWIERDADAFDVWRMENAIPLVTKEIGPEDTPLEAGLMDAVSMTKGCYLGQEVMARGARLGRVTRRLVRVAVSDAAGDFPPLPTMLQDAAGVQVGEIRALAPRGQSWLGLAFLKRRTIEQRGSLFMTNNNKPIEVYIK